VQQASLEGAGGSMSGWIKKKDRIMKDYWTAAGNHAD